MTVAKRIYQSVCDRWDGPGGFAHILRLALPLIVSHGAHTVQLYVDSVMLSRFDRNAMAAASLAGIAHWTMLSFFMGIVGYVNTFVAQYTGAGRNRRVGPAVWQGLYVALGAGLLMLCATTLAKPYFTWANHGEALLGYEITYFRILCVGALPLLLGAVLSGFFTGRHCTKTVMVVNTAAALVNVALNYVLIFGKLGFPEMGLAGAAWGTVTAHVFSACVLVILFSRRRHRQEYATLSGWRPERGLLVRLLRYGGPNGIHHFLDMFSFTLFMTFVGRISPLAVVATTITFRINILAFLPMIGLGIAVSVLVGQALGKDDAALAQRGTYSALMLGLLYTGIMAAGYIGWPRLFLAPFEDPARAAEFEEMLPIALNLLRFVSFYLLFDLGNIVLGSALKGAGDTTFVMVTTVGICWGVMVAPTYLAVRYEWGPEGGLYMAWLSITVTVCIIVGVFIIRFLGGKWKSMRVIETAPVMTPPGESPVDVDL